MGVAGLNPSWTSKTTEFRMKSRHASCSVQLGAMRSSKRCLQMARDPGCSLHGGTPMALPASWQSLQSRHPAAHIKLPYISTNAFSPHCTLKTAQNCIVSTGLITPRSAGNISTCTQQRHKSRLSSSHEQHPSTMINFCVCISIK
jgi:hypothetical protein